MAGKNHHYVPQFYLRNFASDAQKKRISLFYIPESRIIHNASLRDQCSEDKFYERDEVEDWFSKHENYWAPTVADIVTTGTLPTHKSERHIILTTFICFQHARTQRRQAEAKYLCDSYAKTLLAEDPNYNHIGLTDFEIELENPFSLTLSNVNHASRSILDMRMHLMHAPDSNIITFDDPVIKYNSWCENAGDGGMIGWVKSGLQIFCPLSPTTCLLLYDDLIYRVDNRRSSNSTLRDTDVQQLNLLQHVNADNCVFISDSITIRDAHSAHSKATKHRNREKVRHIIADSVNDNSTIVHTYFDMSPINLQLSCISVQKRHRGASKASRLNMYRPHAIKPDVEPIDRFANGVRKKTFVQRTKR